MCSKEGSEAILPALGITGAVKDGDHDNDIRLYDKEHLIRESPCQSPADTSVDRWVLKRVAQDGVYGRIDSHEQIRAQTGDSAFVPVEGLREFCLGFRTNDEPVPHLRLAILSRTTGQGAPTAGSLR